DRPKDEGARGVHAGIALTPAGAGFASLAARLALGRLAAARAAPRTAPRTARRAIARTITRAAARRARLAVPVLAARRLPARRRLGRRRAARRRALAGGTQDDLGAVAQLVGAVDDDPVAGLQARQHGHLVAVGRAGLHRPHGDGVIGVDQVDEAARGAELDG